MIYALLPFLSAAFYGLSYVLLEKILKSVSMLSYMLVSSIFLTTVLIGIALLKPGFVSFDFLSDRKTALVFVVAVVVGIAGWIATLIGLQNTSATYVSFAEISYPLFTLLFLFLLFGEHQLNVQSLIGGALVMAGSIVLLMSRT